MAAIIIQTKTVTQNTPLASSSVTFDAPVTAGNQIILVYAGDAYVATGAIPTGFSEPIGARQEIYLGHYLWCKTAQGGETQFSVTPATSCTYVFVAMEVAGITAVLGSNGVMQTGGSASYATPNLTLSAGMRFIVASLGGSDTNNFTGIGAWTNSFTEQADGSTTLASGTRDSLGVATLQLSAAQGQTINASGTWNGGSQPQSRTAIIVAFNAGPPDSVPPTTVTNVHVLRRQATSLSLSWDPATDDVGVDHYAVFVNASSTPAWTGSITNCKLTGLTNATSYSIQVRAYDSAQNASPLSQVVMAVTLDGSGHYYWDGTSRHLLVARSVTAAPLYQKVAIIGDSLADEAGQGEQKVPASLVSVGWNASGVFFYAWPGKEIADPDPGGHTTVWNIQQVRAAMGEPELWIIPLGTNGNSDSDAKTNTDLQTVFTELGPSARLLWVNVGTSNPSNSDTIRRNALVATAIANRPHSRLADWYTYVNGIDQTGIWTDGTHMTDAGWAIRNQYIAQQSVIAMQTL